MTAPTNPLEGFVRANAALWSRGQSQRRAGPAISGGVILVDLMVDHPQYYIANLVVAKHLQRLTGARLVGLLDSRAHEKPAIVARSFGVREMHYVTEEAAASLAPSLPAVARRLRPLSGPALRQTLLGLGADGIAIGDLVYDTALRANAIPTIERCDNGLLMDVSLALNYVRFYGLLFARHDVRAVVVGHACYSSFGTLTRTADAYGADTYIVHKMKLRVSVLRHNALPAAQRCRYRIAPDTFAAAWCDPGRSRTVAAGRRIIDDRFAGRDTRQGVSLEGFADDKVVMDARDIVSDLDSGRPVACIMAPTLADAPHENGRNIYDDQFQWLVETLRIAAATPSTTWLVKLHPLTGRYLDRGHIDRAVAEHAGGAHVRILDERMHSRSLLGVIDAILTPWGTAGVEFSVKGVPTITAGNTFYTDLGFSIDARTAGEYAAAARAIDKRPLPQEARDRAALAAWLHFDAMLTDCPLLPEIEARPRAPFDEFEMFGDLHRRALAYDPSSDPLAGRVAALHAEAAKDGARAGTQGGTLCPER